MKRTLCATALCSAICTALFAGCGGGDDSGGRRTMIRPADREAAQAKFTTLCSTCHGIDGAGHGPASEGLDPQPRDFQDPDWQRSVTDGHIERIIVKGGAGVGKSVAMPSNPDLAGKPGVVAALREYVRGLAKDAR